MSASREKKKRLENVGAETGSVEQGKKGLGKAAKTIIGIVVAIALIAVVVFFGMVNTGYFEKHSTAAAVGNHKLSPAMMNYYYASAVEQNGQILSIATDPKKPLSEQAYFTEEFDTWADYLKNAAVETAAASYAAYDEAMSNGFVLSENGQNSIKQEMDMLDAMGKAYGSANAVLAGRYGKGCDAKSYEEFLTVNITASEYRRSVVDGFTYTQEEKDAYYAEHTAELDGYDFRTYTVAAEAPQPEEGAENAEAADTTITDEAKQAAEEAAKAIAEAGLNGEDAFLDAVAADHNKDAEADADTEYDAAAATLRTDFAPINLSDADRQWIADEARQAGDTTYVANEDGTAYTVYYFLGKTDHDYKLPTVRHILFAANNQDAAPEALEANKAAAKAQAEDALKEFEAGEATEDAFAEMAKNKSADQGSAANGGLIEDIVKGTYVEPFENWAYDESRKPGDTGIVETQYGYHVMYYVGEGATFHDYIVENTMKNEDFQAWYDTLMENTTFELISGKYMAKR